MQMLPYAVNSHTESNKYQYIFVEKLLYNITCHQTIGANYKLDFHYIFTTKLLEPILNYIYTTFSLHFHHIYMSPNHWSQLQTRLSLYFHHIFTTKLLEPIVNYFYTTFSLHFHHIYMSPNHWSQLQTRYLLHFTTFSPHLLFSKPLEPITNLIFATFSLQNYWIQF